MSRLAKEVYTHDTKQYVPLTDYDIKSSFDSPIRPLYGIKYRIGLRLAYDIIVQEGQPEVYDMIVARAKREIVEYVFGEFREPISKTRLALFNRDFDSALRALDKLENQMFSPE